MSKSMRRTRLATFGGGQNALAGMAGPAVSRPRSVTITLSGP